MSYRVRPIDVWPTPLNRRPKRSQFKAGWTATRNTLYRELDAIGAHNVVLMLAIEEGDIRIDGELRASAHPEHPGVIIAFESRYGPLKYTSDTFDRWQENVRAIALGLEALRKVDRYGITKRGEQYTGWKQIGTGAIVVDAAHARAVLDEYGGDWRQALKVTHPDHGGDPEAFRRVNEARRLLEAVAP